MVISKDASSRARGRPIAHRGDEAVTLLTRLSEQAWLLSGREIRTYVRAELPIRRVPFPHRLACRQAQEVAIRLERHARRTEASE